jgi:hypothetical protein
MKLRYLCNKTGRAQGEGEPHINEHVTQEAMLMLRVTDII